MVRMFSSRPDVPITPPATVWPHIAPGSYRLVVGEKVYSFTVVEGQTTRIRGKVTCDA